MPEPRRTARPALARPALARRALARAALALPGLALVGGCQTPPDRGDRTAPRVTLAPGDTLRTRVALPAATRLTLTGVAIHNNSATTPTATVLDGWWRVAMRQSRRFDVAAGVESCASDHRIQVHLDAKTGCFTSSLHPATGAAMPLAAACDPSPTRGLDRLAWLTRAALGERPAMTPIPCAAGFSADPECVRWTERGLQQRAAGQLRPALRSLQKARSYDGGCALTLLHLATTTAAFGGDDAARSAHTIASEALGLRLRLTPHTEHRLARVLLVARRDDDALLRLGQEYRKDRPHDPHALYSIGLARLGRGEHAAAQAALQPLLTRWPNLAAPQYQLCFALLGIGRPKQALTILEAVRPKLPPGATVRPMAMALFHAGAQDRLREYLAALRRGPGVRGTPAEYEILRMQASHAILTHHRAQAVRHLVDGLLFVQRRRADLARYAIEIAEDGEVLARLGAREELRRALDGFQQLGQLPGTFANAMTYLGGLLDVGANRDPAGALATLAKSRATTWRWQLSAALHHRRGELDAETRALEEAVGGSQSPLLQANVVRALDASGQRQAAAKVAAHVRERLLAFDQRRPFDHPLMTPGRALAYRAVATR